MSGRSSNKSGNLARYVSCGLAPLPWFLPSSLPATAIILACHLSVSQFHFSYPCQLTMHQIFCFNFPHARCCIAAPARVITRSRSTPPTPNPLAALRPVVNAPSTAAVAKSTARVVPDEEHLDAAYRFTDPASESAAATSTNATNESK
jgi:hypothetical protein